MHDLLKETIENQAPSGEGSLITVEVLLEEAEKQIQDAIESGNTTILESAKVKVKMALQSVSELKKNVVLNSMVCKRCGSVAMEKISKYEVDGKSVYACTNCGRDECF